ncbi:hypothetical protein [Enterococcus wangshanyuanii]|uniref:Uncharacterized protein n=1 Tax=Enterococcus wangshanyuanii TaxID=2005703 RepID=A0ABQ1PME9_9ENTE|nr:hypothetical protein [Enterococcus wangshanyuanii]GGC99619.1 hypothetical protein GCM10011573_31460 [Enterococcus wangshanyuanii]
MTFIYGALKVDFSGNTPNESYGLLYSFFVLPAIFVVYLVAFLVNIFVAGKFLKDFKRKSRLLQLLISIYGTTLLIGGIIFLRMGYLALFPYVAFFAPGTIGICLTTICLAVTGWLIVDKSADEIKDHPEKLEVKTIIIGLFLPICVLGITVGARIGMLTMAQGNRDEEYRKTIEQKLQGHGMIGDVKIIKAYDSSGKSDRVQLDYTMTQDGITVYSKGVLYRSDQKSGWILEDSSLTTYNKSIETILQVPAHSKEAKEFLDTFKQEVEKSIKKSKLTDKIGLDTPLEKNEIRTAYDLPYLAFNYEQDLKEIRQLAEKNARSSDKKKAAFGGFAALSIEQLMNTHTIIANMPIQYPYVEGSDFDEREANAVLYQALVIKNLDYSKLMDGYYEISVDEQRTRSIISIKDQHLDGMLDIMSMSMLENPTDDLGSFSSSDYMEW